VEGGAQARPELALTVLLAPVFDLGFGPDAREMGSQETERRVLQEPVVSFAPMQPKPASPLRRPQVRTI
jgi:hypothetical protein